VLYTGITNDLKRRIIDHYLKINEKSFTSQYNVHYLLYFEEHGYVINAIEREKEIKRMTRRKKMELINTKNPGLKFLNEELFGCWPPKDLNSWLKSKGGKDPG
jgi:putative endonuclease